MQRLGDQHAGRNEEQRVAVGCRAREFPQRRNEIAAGFVLDEDGRAEGSLIFCDTSRAITSVAPPAASPTRRRIGLPERSCAVAAGGGTQNKIAQTRRPNTVRRCMRSSLAMREAQLLLDGVAVMRRESAAYSGLMPWASMNFVQFAISFSSFVFS